MISDSLLEEAQHELSRGNHWVAYNTKTYFLDNADMWFFPSKDEAFAFADDNFSDYEAYDVLHANSIDELLKQFPYGQDLEKQISDPDANGLHNKDGNAFSDELIEHWEDQQKEDLITNKNNPMVERNLDYLKNNVRNHGFGESLGPEIEAQLKSGVAEFTLSHKAEVNKREIEATLYFKKSDTTDMYFFNKYDTKLKNEKDESMAQTFYINNGWGVTLKEAYNLLNGRAVHKELTNKDDQKYTAWIQLDFSAKDTNGNYERKQYHQNYGYDLKEALSYYPIKEMTQASEMETLLKSIERGNLQMVTIKADGGDVRVFIEANPQYKSITVYDSSMRRMNQEQRQELMQQPALDKSKEQKQSLAGEGKEEKKQVKARRPNGDGQDKLVKKVRTKPPGQGQGV